MDDRELALREIAESKRMLLDWFRSDVIFTQMFSNDPKPLYRWEGIFGGTVTDGYKVPDNKDPTRHERWGRYVWVLTGEEAYAFCKDALEHFYEHDLKRYAWCENCIDAHENRRHIQTQS